MVLYFVFGFGFFICNCVCVLYLAHVISFLTLLRSLSYSFFFISCWSHLYRSTFHLTHYPPRHCPFVLLICRCCCCCRLPLVCVVVLIVVFVPAKNVLDDENIHIYILYMVIKNTRALTWMLFSYYPPIPHIPLKKQLLFINFVSRIHF